MVCGTTTAGPVATTVTDRAVRTCEPWTRRDGAVMLTTTRSDLS